MPSFDEFMISLGDGYRDYLYKNPLQRMCMCRKKEIRLPDVKAEKFPVIEDSFMRYLEDYDPVKRFILSALMPDADDGFIDSLIDRVVLLYELEEGIV